MLRSLRASAAATMPVVALSDTSGVTSGRIFILRSAQYPPRSMVQTVLEPETLEALLDNSLLAVSKV